MARQHLVWSRALQNMTLEYAARKEARERELLTLKAQDRYLAFCATHPDLAREFRRRIWPTTGA